MKCRLYFSETQGENMNHINDVKGEKKIGLIIAIGHDEFPLTNC